MEARIVYFDNIGGENTDEVLRIAKQRAEELGIKTIVVASTRGDTAAKAVEVFSGLRVIVIGQSTGFREQNVQPFTEENRKIVESKGGIIHIATHAFAGTGKAVKYKFDTAVAGDMENFSINGTDQTVTALSRDFVGPVGGFQSVSLLSSGAEASERTFELHAVMEG